MARTDITRLRQKASTDRTELDRLLDEVRVGHVAVAGADGTPVAFPTLVVRDGDRVLIHGSAGSPWLRRLSEGVPTALTATCVEGIVVARSAYESSLHYRSAVIFGTCALIEDADKLAALDVITDALIPGRVPEIRRPHPKELAATRVLALPIAEWSLKVSAAWPDDDPEDVAGNAWAGVVSLAPRAYAVPRPAPDLRTGIPVPGSVRALFP